MKGSDLKKIAGAFLQPWNGKAPFSHAQQAVRTHIMYHNARVAQPLDPDLSMGHTPMCYVECLDCFAGILAACFLSIPPSSQGRGDRGRLTPTVIKCCEGLTPSTRGHMEAGRVCLEVLPCTCTGSVLWKVSLLYH